MVPGNISQASLAWGDNTELNECQRPAELLLVQTVYLFASGEAIGVYWPSQKKRAESWTSEPLDGTCGSGVPQQTGIATARYIHVRYICALDILEETGLPPHLNIWCETVGGRGWLPLSKGSVMALQEEAWVSWVLACCAFNLVCLRDLFRRGSVQSRLFKACCTWQGDILCLFLAKRAANKVLYIWFDITACLIVGLSLLATVCIISALSVFSHYTYATIYM